MNIKIEGYPGTGNHFTDIHIHHVKTYAPNAATVINNHAVRAQLAKEPEDREMAAKIRTLLQR